MWFPTSDELWQAGVITRIAGLPDGTKGAEVARQGSEGLPGAMRELPSPAEVATATKEDVEKTLQKNSLYVAIKRADPQTYQRILVAVGDAIRSGKSPAEIAALPQPFVYDVIRKHRSQASDEAIVALGELTAAEIEAIGRKDMEACYRFLFPGSAPRPISLWEYLPPATLERGFVSAISDLTETAATGSKRVPASKEVLQLHRAVIEIVAQRYSVTYPLALTNPHSPNFSHEMVCRAFGALFKEALTLSTRDRAQLLRFLLVGGPIN
jgi:hypothetical protein